MSAEVFLNGKVSLCCGDSIHFLRDQPENRYDSIVTDPPYALVSIVKRFANSPRSERTENTENPYGRTGRGFMGQRWDNGSTAHAVEFWAEVLRVLKPGGHVVAFAGTRTYHRLACAIEDAGFEIRDQLQWIFGSGFPKSHDVSKGIDRAAGAEREITGTRELWGNNAKGGRGGQYANGFADVADGSKKVFQETAPATSEAQQWEGWGTALKPASEPICLARKPLSEKTIAANVLKWGTGAINVDGCRIEADWANDPSKRGFGYGFNSGQHFEKTVANAPHSKGGLPTQGRWPANIIHDGSDEVVAAFPDAPGQQQDVALDAPSARTGNIYGKMNRHGEKSADSRYSDKGSTNFAALPGIRRNDSGSAARFFYAAKADSDDRLGSKHPTVKPIDLMQWLIRLVTPKGGLVLDPFAGTGTTAEACFREGMRCMLVEREAEYQVDIRRRMALIMSGPDERSRESIKAKIGNKEPDHGPLFGGQ